MIYYTTKEIFYALLNSFGVGVFLGFLASLTDVVFDIISTAVYMSSKTITLIKEKDKRKRFFKDLNRLKKAAGAKAVFLKDLLFSLISGFSVSLLLYLSSDGKIRGFVIFAVLVSFLLSKKTVGKTASALFDFVALKVLKIALCVLITALRPFFFLARKARFAAARITDKKIKLGLQDKRRKRERKKTRSKIVHNSVKNAFLR